MKLTNPSLVSILSTSANVLLKRLFAFILLVQCSSAYAKHVPENLDENPIEETSVIVDVENLGRNKEIPSIVFNEMLYLSVTHVFNYLKIKNEVSSSLDSITGFFVNPQAVYVIDKKNNRIEYLTKIFYLRDDDIIRVDSNFYLKSNFFGQVFGLRCVFKFRSMSATLNSEIELPIIREMKQELARLNLKKLKGETTADTTYARRHPFFHPGTVNWSVVANNSLNGQNNARYYLGFGALLAGGDAIVSLNHNSNSSFQPEKQFYMWRYINNNTTALKQIMIGRLNIQPTASIYSPILGIRVNNSTTSLKHSYGVYTLRDFTEPKTTVELYINDVLVDYMQSDEAGQYSFQVPLLYGNTEVKLKFYGKWGEETVKTKNINVPYIFMQPGAFEYDASAGLVQDGENSRFYSARFHYGLLKQMTINGGFEYLSSLDKMQYLPFISTSMRLAPRIIATGEYTHGVRMQGMLNYSLPSGLRVDMQYTKYEKEQEAVTYNNLEGFKGMVSLPIHGKRYSALTRLTANYNKLQNSSTTYINWYVGGTYNRISPGISAFSIINGEEKPNIYSNFSIAFRLPYRFALGSEAQYDFSGSQLMSMRFKLDKSWKHGAVNATFERNMINPFNSFTVGLQYDFSYFNVGLSGRQTNNITSFIQRANGSIVFDTKTKNTHFTSTPSVGRGGIVIVPYLDLNGNDFQEKNEPRLNGLEISINGGKTSYDLKDTVIRIYNLEAYRTYEIQVNKASFDNIAWKVKKPSLAVVADPDAMRLIKIPVQVMGEVSGTVKIATGNDTSGKGRIIINFYNEYNIFMGRTITDSEGYYSYLALSPGKYFVSLDQQQLKKLHLSTDKPTVVININPKKEGDIIDGINFNLNAE